MIIRIVTGIIFAGLAATGSCSALADEFRLHSRVGQCEYSFNPMKDTRFTKCAAEAYVINSSTSEIYSCRAEIEGDQFLAPSVAENAPETIVCTRLGQPFPRAGDFDMAHTDDTAKADRTLNRIQGTFTWKNAFWIFSRTSLDLKFCANRLSDAGPDYRIKCSRNVDWRK